MRRNKAKVTGPRKRQGSHNPADESRRSFEELHRGIRTLNAAQISEAHSLIERFACPDKRQNLHRLIDGLARLPVKG